MKKNPSIKVLYLFFLLIILVVIAMYYVMMPSNNGRTSSLIGEPICGNLGESDAQDACCTEIHTGEPTIACVGGWQYVNEGTTKCQFICQGAFPHCPTDIKECSSTVRVRRNASNDCRFDACP